MYLQSILVISTSFTPGTFFDCARRTACAEQLSLTQKCRSAIEERNFNYPTSIAHHDLKDPNSITEKISPSLLPEQRQKPIPAARSLGPKTRMHMILHSKRCVYTPMKTQAAETRKL
ncbi:hypothetical protein I7I51_04274 [Histoplasma capsulatum]|uniref:Uncharacterized protein n=1 Tax=Ajellomyces capsulatus TaxID=5037 RepID=A0A8A1MD66_AJECA|nr:hypothetical protein I7I51_04274 [Histoplasma capsulatum]